MNNDTRAQQPDTAKAGASGRVGGYACMNVAGCVDTRVQHTWYRWQKLNREPGVCGSELKDFMRRLYMQGVIDGLLTKTETQ